MSAADRIKAAGEVTPRDEVMWLGEYRPVIGTERSGDQVTIIVRMDDSTPADMPPFGAGEVMLIR